MDTPKYHHFPAAYNHPIWCGASATSLYICQKIMYRSPVDCSQIQGDHFRRSIGVMKHLTNIHQMRLKFMRWGINVRPQIFCWAGWTLMDKYFSISSDWISDGNWVVFVLPTSVVKTRFHAHCWQIIRCAFKLIILGLIGWVLTLSDCPP